jgi:hypothetical protein
MTRQDKTSHDKTNLTFFEKIWRGLRTSLFGGEVGKVGGGGVAREGLGLGLELGLGLGLRLALGLGLGLG